MIYNYLFTMFNAYQTMMTLGWVVDHPHDRLETTRAASRGGSGETLAATPTYPPPHLLATTGES
jgi:hypothetical protein